VTTIDWEAREGSPFPLGVSRRAQEHAYNFALYSRHGTRVALLLYSDDAVSPVLRIDLDPIKNKSGRIWHCRVPDGAIGIARYYAYSVDGESGAEHRFDPAKVLLDPYARAIFFPPGFDREACRRPGSNAGTTPLGMIDPGIASPDASEQRKPRHTSDLVIYEAHVKGYTMRANSGVDAEKRGTYLGMIDKIPYLKELGVTAVELMPVQQYDPGERNYWGYMTLNFFAVHSGYARGGDSLGAIDEFRKLVKAFHQAEIEVILDVVYNHTTEMSDAGPTYSFRGIDNSTYYLMQGGRYRDDTGTGNVVRTAHPAVRNLIIESLRYWVKTFGVDGFRFDLASIFTRNSDGSVNLEESAVISEISSDPELANVRLIAEAWDTAAYQLGRSFPGNTWFQWNGKFRDDLRAFVKSDNGMIAAVLTRLYGSDDLFPDDVANAYHPYQSINFVTAHDGLCLYDLVAYNQKHNEANGQRNRDGTDDNRSWNCGWEGDSQVPPQVLALRKQQVKNICCLLFLSNGTPMFCAGDEFLNTQHGNNNPYNQDNETSWLDWDRLELNRDIFTFFKKMIAFRKAHPSLARSRYWRGDIAWYGVDGPVDFSYTSHALAFRLSGASEQDQDLYVMVNAYWEPLTFRIQDGAPGGWARVIDTALQPPLDFLDAGSELPVGGAGYTVRARSVVVLLRR
jgi:glycogen operon protein